MRLYSEGDDMPKVKGGRALYGHVLGIIVMDTKFPRIPGDSGNVSTYDFPVRPKVVKVKTALPLVEFTRDDPDLLQECIRAAQELEREGVRAIISTCGFSLIFQERVANAVNIPVFLSSLMQIPIAYRAVKKGKKIGIITRHSKELTHDFLKRCGIESSILPSIVVEGFEDEPDLDYGAKPPYISDPWKNEKVLCRVAKRLISKHPDVGAIVLEMHNLPPFSAAIQEVTGLPIFDIQTLAKLAYNVMVQKRYTGLM